MFEQFDEVLCKSVLKKSNLEVIMMNLFFKFLKNLRLTLITQKRYGSRLTNQGNYKRSNSHNIRKYYRII